MIDDILEYIESYENVRALTGLDDEYELLDEVINLVVYRNQLFLNLTTFVNDEGNLFELIDGGLLDDEQLSLAQVYCMYFVAEKILLSVGLRALKSKTDGKSNATRFSPESTYRETLANIQGGLLTYSTAVRTMMGINLTDGITQTYLSISSPETDLVTDS